MKLITYDEKEQIFHLSNNRISYLIQIEEENIPAHLYFGKRIRRYHHHFQYPRTDRSFSPNPPFSEERQFSFDTVMQEFPGNPGDYRTLSYELLHETGSRVSDFRYYDYTIEKGKPKLSGLPATYINGQEEAETLTIILKDQLYDLYLELSYTIFADQSVITRSNRLRNESDEQVFVNKLASLTLDFAGRPLELIHLNGTWSKERMMMREAITPGIKLLGSTRGSSSHHQNPFAAIAAPETTEDQGEVYGFSLVYSGNHQTTIERDPYDQVRVTMGINPHQFSWKLAQGEQFQSPEAVMVYSDQGLNGMSQSFHSLFQDHLVRGNYQYAQRPILANNWEATFFDFDEEKILAIAKEARDLGAELFVLDDGWYGHRDNDDSSLGDWVEDKNKLPNGLAGLSRKVHEMGLKFGLWVEPEMISEDSELFRQHPDWALQVPGRGKTVGRGQFVLDFSRQDVRENIYQQLKNIFEEVPLEYVKWDMNRNMTEVYSTLLAADQQGETAHRYMLGLYEFLERLTTEFPAILFESCSGGGGRFDPGMLYYMPQVWASDNTDAVSRMQIQYGTSLVYPISSIGAHVAAVPNHQTGRITSLETRGNVAMSGVFGYELDLTHLSDEEKELMKQQVAFYKEHRQLIQYGSYYRLKSPFEGNQASWLFVDEKKTEALVFYSRILAEASTAFHVLKLTGLDPNKEYIVEGQIIGGDELMHLGLYIDEDMWGDYASKLIYLKEVD
ncbi:alpha-galactosidase [Enterococcus sp. BWM-S5]|uniref:Alpha-galactosidase n=1 Tax=Enterococcus larvae TaxID=2794352 RepID=A0ABS4CDV0_9ENTE|nr:alpha-galactosidase [Enterococcus larvae]MBP1044745.1 alpha-galactosidase [Enterococcus larvae]